MPRRKLPKKHSKLKIAAIAATTIALSAAATGVAVASQPDTLVVSVEGKPKTVETKADTVGELLRQEGVKVNAKAVVNHKLSTPIKDKATVEVLYKKPVKVISDGKLVEKEVAAVTVKDALAKLSLKPTAKSSVSMPLNTRIPTAGVAVVVSNPKAVRLVAAGQDKFVVSSAVTVGDLLKEQNIQLAPQDEVSKPLTAYTEPGASISVVAVATKTEKEVVKRPIVTVKREDPNLLEGTTEVAAAGKARTIEKTYELVFADGAVRSRKLVKKEVTEPGSPKVVLTGTAVPPPAVQDEPSTPEFKAVAPGTARALGLKLMLAAGYDKSEWPCLDKLYARESGWRVNADNPNSSAYGIPQALPGSKMQSAGSDWATNPETQIKWGLGYIKDRHGSPCEALAFSDANGWY